MPSFVFVEKRNAAIQHRARIRVALLFAAGCGAMFRRRSVPTRPSAGWRPHLRIDASPSTCCLFLDLAVVWINSAMDAVDKALAKRWHPVYVRPGRHVSY
jgi:hypothetical protein